MHLLFQRYLNNECTADEVKELLKYFEAEENEVFLKKLIREQLEEDNDANLIPSQEYHSLLDTTLGNIKKTIAPENSAGPAISLPIYKRNWFRAGVAAVFIGVISATAFFFLHQKKQAAVAQQESHIQQDKDRPPGRQNAILTLDDGTTIELDSAADGTLAQQGNSNVLKVNGQIAYHKSGIDTTDKKPVYNTITTANSNQYQLVLSDGSKVWLNAASSIRFPAAFSANERKVEITGEAYFEVAKDERKPFRVAFNNQAGGKDEVEVLGTHFNINAYPEEHDTKTTLLEGSVKIKRLYATQMLSPGEQAALTANDIVLNRNVDVSEVVAWKEGFFLFNNSDIETIMRQVARWYDVDINFEGKITEERFSGKISRNVTLSKFLKVLELNDVHVRMEGRKVTVGH